MAEPAVSGAAILLVDDRRSNLVALHALLEPLGRRIVDVASGEEALKRLLVDEFAVILLDVQMPGMDGFELARHVRAHPRTRNTPMIFVTALSTATDHIYEGYEAGAVDYILKPIDPVILRSKVSVFLELSEMHSRLRHEAELRAVQDSLALAQRAGNSGMWDVDLLGGRVFWSDEYVDLIGLPSDASDPRAWLDVVDPRDRPSLAVRFGTFLERGDVWDEEYRVVHPTRGLRWIGARGRILRDESGAAARFTGIAVDISERKHVEDRLARLHAAAAVVAAAASPVELIGKIAEQGRLIVGAAAAWLAVVPKDAAPRIVAVSPEGANADRDGPALSGPVLDAALDALASGALATVARNEHAPAAPTVRLAGSTGPLNGTTILTVVSRGDDEAIVLGLELDTHAAPSDATRRMLAAAVLQFGQGLERTRAFQAERVARRRTEALQGATRALGDARSERETADLIVKEGLRMFGAVSAGLRLVRGEQAGLQTVASAGFPDGLARPAGGSPLELGSPTTDCVRERRSILLRSADTIAQRYGASDDGTAAWPGLQALAAVPIMDGGRAIGALGLRFGEARSFAAADRDALEAFCALAAHALSNANLRAAQDRQRLHDAIVAEATLALDLDLDLAQRLDRFAETMTSRLADACIVDLRLDDETVVGAAARSSAEASLLRRRRRSHSGPAAWESHVEVLGTGRSFVYPTLSEDDLATLAPWLLPDELGDGQPAPRPTSAVIVPIPARMGNIGTLLLLSFRDDLRFDHRDADLAAQLGRRAGLAFENAVLYAAQSNVADLLQRSLLPAELPVLVQLPIAARYVSAAVGTEAGGDWFEAVEVGENRVVLAVGDIVGHGTTSAAVMGQVRSAARAYAIAGLGPGQILDRLSAFAARVPGAEASTALCAVVDIDAGTIRWAAAGHPPLLLVQPSGAAEFMFEGRGSPLAFNREPYGEARATLTGGSTVVLYTDGAVERRGEVIDTGLDRLAALATASLPGDPDALCDRMLLRLFADGPPLDDVALVVARYTAPVGPLEIRMAAEPGELRKLRRTVQEWLDSLSLPASTCRDIILAIGEVSTNVVEHAYRDKPGEIEIRLEPLANGAIQITVADRGTWRSDPAGEIRGRGMAIARAVMQSVRVDTGEDGTTVRMTNRPSKRVELMVGEDRFATGGGPRLRAD